VATVISTNNKRASAVPRGRSITIEDIWQELQEVRAALEAEKRKSEQLEKRVKELEKENQELRKGRWATENFLQGQIRKLEKDVADRDKKLEKKEKQLKWLRKKVFGKSTEKEKAAPKAKDNKTKSDSKKNRGQQPGSEGHGRTDRSNIRVADTVELAIPGGCNCPECGKAYLVLPVTEDSSLHEIAIDLFQIIFKQLKYVSQCQCRGKRIVTAAPPPRLYARTDIGNSLWVYLVVQKFLHGVPTNRTLKDLSLYGFSLAEGTVTGGLKIINDLLDQLYEGIANHCRGADLWNADETTWRIFDSGKARWWLWLIASDDAVAYILDPSRSKKVPSEFFAGSTGVLMTDRLASYKALQESIRKAWCWVHIRRDFLNIFNGVKHLKRWAKKWLKRIAELLVLGHRRFKLWECDQDSGPEWDAVQNELKAHIEKLECEWKRELKQQTLHDEQKKVLRSLKRHWAGLTLFLEDPRIPLHNNRAERLLRHAVILRKNSFGSGTKWAGELAAKLFSIFQTWLINGLDPQSLLLDYFNECSKTPGRAPPNINQFLPWTISSERKQQFALPASYKRPG
jgi:transposase